MRNRLRRACGTPPTSRGRRAAAGFTLLEMLAVIVLVAIAVTVVAIAATRGLNSARVRAASTDLAAALRHTRTQAIVHSTPKALTVNVAARRYTAAGADPRTLPETMDVAVTSARADQDADKARIRFFPDGSSTGGHITLTHGARQWRVNVAWLTGAVSVHTSTSTSAS